MEMGKLCYNNGGERSGSFNTSNYFAVWRVPAFSGDIAWQADLTELPVWYVRYWRQKTLLPLFVIPEFERMLPDRDQILVSVILLRSQG